MSRPLYSCYLSPGFYRFIRLFAHSFWLSTCSLSLYPFAKKLSRMLGYVLFVDLTCFSIPSSLYISISSSIQVAKAKPPRHSLSYRSCFLLSSMRAGVASWCWNQCAAAAPLRFHLTHLCLSTYYSQISSIDPPPT